MPEPEYDLWVSLPDEEVPQHMPVAPDHPDDYLCDRCGRSIWSTVVHYLRKGGPSA